MCWIHSLICYFALRLEAPERFWNLIKKRSKIRISQWMNTNCASGNERGVGMFTLWVASKSFSTIIQHYKAFLPPALVYVNKYKCGGVAAGVHFATDSQRDVLLFGRVWWTNFCLRTLQMSVMTLAPFRCNSSSAPPQKKLGLWLRRDVCSQFPWTIKMCPFIESSQRVKRSTGNKKWWWKSLKRLEIIKLRLIGMQRLGAGIRVTSSFVSHKLKSSTAKDCTLQFNKGQRHSSCRDSAAGQVRWALKVSKAPIFN